MTELAPLMQEVQVEQRILIFEEGEPGDCMYIIFKREIEIHKGKTILAILKAKELFVELSLLDAEARSATATAITTCILFKIDQQPFYELIKSGPEVAMGFIKILCKRLRQLHDKTSQRAG